MENKKLAGDKILIVEDENITRTSLARIVGVWGCKVVAVDSAEAALQECSRQDFTVVLTDIQLPGRSGLELLADLAARPNPPAVIMMTAYSTVSSAVEAMRAGAHTYLGKPVIIDELRLILERLAASRQEHAELRRLRTVLRGGEPQGPAGLVGRSPVMQRLFTLISRVADSPSSVLIQGESGTGKELVARAVHEQSGRRDRRFVAIDCGALPANLLESELFGYEPGAFTGAVKTKPGLFEIADGGTLFLDEVAEAPPEIQVKLLRALQEKVIRRLGGTRDIPCDTRVVCATNRDLDRLVVEGKFRAELLYRIRVVALPLPPLRERPGDLPLLIEHFLKKYNALLNRQVRGLTPEALQRALAYAWPGNIRELENTIESALNLTDGDLIPASALPLPVAAAAVPDGSHFTSWGYRALKRDLLTRFETAFFRQLLAECAGNISEASRRSGLDRKNLYLKLYRHRLIAKPAVDASER